MMIECTTFKLNFKLGATTSWSIIIQNADSSLALVWSEYSHA